MFMKLYILKDILLLFIHELSLFLWYDSSSSYLGCHIYVTMDLQSIVVVLV